MDNREIKKSEITQERIEATLGQPVMIAYDVKARIWPMKPVDDYTRLMIEIWEGRLQTQVLDSLYKSKKTN